MFSTLLPLFLHLDTIFQWNVIRQVKVDVWCVIAALFINLIYFFLGILTYRNFRLANGRDGVANFIISDQLCGLWHELRLVVILLNCHWLACLLVRHLVNRGRYYRTVRDQVSGRLIPLLLRNFRDRRGDVINHVREGIWSSQVRHQNWCVENDVVGLESLVVVFMLWKCWL